MKRIIFIFVALISFTALSAQSLEFANTVITLCDEPAEGYGAFDQTAYNKEVAAKIQKSLAAGELTKNPVNVGIERVLSPEDRKIIAFEVSAKDMDFASQEEVYAYFDRIDKPENKEWVGFTGENVYVSVRFNKGFYLVGVFKAQNGGWMYFQTSDLRSASTQPLTLMLNNGKNVEILNDWGLLTLKYDNKLCMLGKFHAFAGKAEMEFYKGTFAKYLHVREIKK